VQTGTQFWHVGDLSYADGKQPIWDAFGNMMQSVSTTLPPLVSDFVVLVVLWLRGKRVSQSPACRTCLWRGTTKMPTSSVLSAPSPCATTCRCLPGLYSNLLVLPSAIFFVFSSTNRCRTFIDLHSFTGGDLERYYYSFDFGSVHFINLDSEHDYAVGSAQYR
jgi:hypothetical protein